ncbi:nucleotidyltransferase family protein [Rhodophyticola porphyridii]|uniref:Nucleotidyltransferase family protein n=1 Tax=Rhodophyticola porphyridii TaxID=1852017 RepID=A0A3L9Y585_9RHOB|nr:nucleotidyltransferase family protein [Rhodophyticola porphyridii]RMA43552.1 nucleotidyltransferase family protein [Rhodophyticola porphyridii]
MTPRSCMILAAGFVRRMGALAADRPKPLIEVAGRPMIEHAPAQARDVGAAPIAVNGHSRADRPAAYLTALKDVSFLNETPEILESGGGDRNALPVLGEGPIWCLNSDAVRRGENALRLLAAGWRPGAMGGLSLLVPRDRAVRRQGGGDFALSETGNITPDRTGLVWTGAQMLDGTEFDDTPSGPFSIWAIWRKLMVRGRMFGAIYRGFWADMGHPGGIPMAEAMLERCDAV